MNRTFKTFTINTTSTPQPLVGTYITAAGTPIGPDFQGEQITTLTVSDTSMFLQGDYVLLQSATYTNKELVRVQKVTNSTTMVIRGSTLVRTGGVFGTGDFVSLAIPVNGVFVQATPGNAALLYIGTVGMVVSGEVKVIASLQNFAAGTQPVYYNDSRYYTADPMGASDLWIAGTSGDGYLPSFPVA
jgi:hypothetical protein